MSTTTAVTPSSPACTLGDVGPNQPFRFRKGGNLFARVGNTSRYRMVGSDTTYAMTDVDLPVLMEPSNGRTVDPDAVGVIERA